MSILGKWHELEVVKIDIEFVYLAHPEGLTEQVEVEPTEEQLEALDPGVELEPVFETKPVLIQMAHNQTERLLKEGQTVKVFLYNKKEGQLGGTMKQPLVELNKFAYLRIVGENNFAYFADIGLDSDLFIHKDPEGFEPETSKKYIITMRTDRQTGKLKGEINLEKVLVREGFEYEKGDKVSCQIIGKTDGGFKISVADKYWAYLRNADAVSHTKMGSKFIGYVTDNKQGSLIVSMEPDGEQLLKQACHKILLMVQEMKYVRLTADSDEEEIKLRLKMSKDTFKKAINQLSSQNLVKATKRGIKLSKP